ncbi:hypothetical protein MYCTH_2311848 [Thermothelomyces thermophilus ATCC 42464]|uniref:Peroxisomal membrane protein PEX14 n=1 Tax=Thermothelomyces thermophilus (strain ATCC 42464 / BCRC 31852 / DSM 1799) TaxID=573729 RepID=G2QPQ5_THET4|nr:uncharacterized protein MYCTH_2311848 [Thermothelomyces thermophilus ATCC 42464]AEO61568.1 hypothetical protein MYCTH_2311848 [Thermothelomyces thermophilus ATCC 42464]
MGETEKETKQDVPAEAAAAEPVPEQSTSQDATLEQARKFLQDAQVRNTTPERKTEFLKSKGLSENVIQRLMNEVAQDAREESPVSKHTEEERIEPPIPKKEDRPPIVTYPEFLTKPARPPPLVTVNGFLNTLYAFGGFSTLVYGASKFVVEPMVQTLTEARISLHDTANQDVAKLVSKLETVVSEIPPTKSKDIRPLSAASARHDGDESDAASSYGDPTELFHRDVGVQTSPDLEAQSRFHSQQQQQQQHETPTDHQSKRLARLIGSLKSLNDSMTDQTETLGDVRTVMDVLQQDVDKLNAAAATDFVGGYSLYGAASKNEPDDEIKRARENIRRVKGVLLSTRSFPVATR